MTAAISKCLPSAKGIHSLWFTFR